LKYVRCILLEKKGDFLRTTFKDNDFWSLPKDDKGYWKIPDYDESYFYDWYDYHDFEEIIWNDDIENFNLIEEYKKEYQIDIDKNKKDLKWNKKKVL
jgi:hypothetical protein